MGVPQHGAQTSQFIISHGKVPLLKGRQYTTAAAGRIYAAAGWVHDIGVGMGENGVVEELSYG
jgi:hypothetical protein